MRYLAYILVFLCFACAKKETAIPFKPFTHVDIDILYKDSTSIRAISVSENEVLFAGSNGAYGNFVINHEKGVNEDGVYNSYFKAKNTGAIDFLDNKPAFRSIANTTNAFFVLSIEDPALLYRYDKKTNEIKLVYIEQVEGIFYDAMTFWNDQEGIAMGDPIENCLSIIITRNGGDTWEKKSCANLPVIVQGEAAFAASDTNIKTIGDHTWIVTGGIKSRILYSPDKGNTWTIHNTPIVQGAETTGAYSMDFYNESLGIIYGGDYTKPDLAVNNIAVTSDGGKTWNTTSADENQGYKSCVQYVPNSNGKELVAIGFTGISYSQDGGDHWREISSESFLSFRFLNDSIAYAGGRNKLARLRFRR